MRAHTREFIIVPINQRTDEWRAWRREGVGASDAPTIMGESPFQTVEELLEDKVSADVEDVTNEAMRRGRELEPEARRHYVKVTGREVQPACLQSRRFAWLRASVDGLAPDHSAVVEIKCGKKAYEISAETGRVPEYYFGQLQHILAVTGLPAIDFWAYWPGRRPVLIAVERDDRYIRRLLVQEERFWQSVLVARSGRGARASAWRGWDEAAERFPRRPAEARRPSRIRARRRRRGGRLGCAGVLLGFVCLALLVRKDEEKPSQPPPRTEATAAREPASRERSGQEAPAVEDPRAESSAGASAGAAPVAWVQARPSLKQPAPEDSAPEVFTLATPLPVSVRLTRSITIASRVYGAVGIGAGQEVRVVERRAESVRVRSGNGEYWVPVSAVNGTVVRRD